MNAKSAYASLHWLPTVIQLVCVSHGRFLPSMCTHGRHLLLLSSASHFDASLSQRPSGVRITKMLMEGHIRERIFSRPLGGGAAEKLKVNCLVVTVRIMFKCYLTQTIPNF